MSIEESILLWIHEYSLTPVEWLFLPTHLVGTKIFFTLFISVAIILHLWRHEWQQIKVWCTVGVFSYILNTGLKNLVARPRPQLWTSIVTESSSAFPSGHALGSAAIFPLAAWLFYQQGSLSIGAFWALSIGIPFVVGIGRMVFGLHYPSDVLAGWLLGALISGTAICWLKRKYNQENR